MQHFLLKILTGRPQQQQQHHHHQNQHQQQQQQQPRHRNTFDDKNRETFGDDFVDHHELQHHRQQHQPHLITPGHVHVLGILRGARERIRGQGNLLIHNLDVLFSRSAVEQEQKCFVLLRIPCEEHFLFTSPLNEIWINMELCFVLSNGHSKFYKINMLPRIQCWLKNNKSRLAWDRLEMQFSKSTINKSELPFIFKDRY